MPGERHGSSLPGNGVELVAIQRTGAQRCCCTTLFRRHQSRRFASSPGRAFEGSGTTARMTSTFMPRTSAVPRHAGNADARQRRYASQRYRRRRSRSFVANTGSSSWVGSDGSASSAWPLRGAAQRPARCGLSSRSGPGGTRPRPFPAEDQSSQGHVERQQYDGESSNHSANDWATVTGGTGLGRALHGQGQHHPAAGAGHWRKKGKSVPMNRSSGE